MADVRTTDFWEQRYREGRTGWDLGGPTSVFVELLESADILDLPARYPAHFEAERLDTPHEDKLAGSDLFAILRRM